MKTFKEFIEHLQEDETFAKEMNEALAAKRAEGAGNVYEALIPVADDFGYAVSVEEINEYQKNQTGELSEEEMGKVSGGASCIAVTVMVSLHTASVALSVSVNYGPKIVEETKKQIDGMTGKDQLYKPNRMIIEPEDMP